MTLARIIFGVAILAIIGLFVYRTFFRSKTPTPTPPSGGGVVTPPSSGNPGLNEKEDQIGDGGDHKKPGTGSVNDSPR